MPRSVGEQSLPSPEPTAVTFASSFVSSAVSLDDATVATVPAPSEIEAAVDAQSVNSSFSSAVPPPGLFLQTCLSRRRSFSPPQPAQLSPQHLLRQRNAATSHTRVSFVLVEQLRANLQRERERADRAESALQQLRSHFVSVAAEQEQEDEARLNTMIRKLEESKQEKAQLARELEEEEEFISNELLRKLSRAEREKQELQQQVAQLQQQSMTTDDEMDSEDLCSEDCDALRRRVRQLRRQNRALNTKVTALRNKNVVLQQQLQAEQEKNSHTTDVEQAVEMDMERRFNLERRMSSCSLLSDVSSHSQPLSPANLPGSSRSLRTGTGSSHASSRRGSRSHSRTRLDTDEDSCGELSPLQSRLSPRAVAGLGPTVSPLALSSTAMVPQSPLQSQSQPPLTRVRSSSSASRRASLQPHKHHHHRHHAHKARSNSKTPPRSSTTDMGTPRSNTVTATAAK